MQKAALLFLLLVTVVVAKSTDESGEQAKRDSDDPSYAWEEWDEDERLRLFPKRGRDVGIGSSLYAALGSVMRQRKHVVAELTPSWSTAASKPQAQAMVTRFEQKMTAGGIGATVFMPDKSKVVTRTETVLDAYLARDFMLKQVEVKRVLIDGIPFTPKPVPTDEDGDEDDYEQNEL